MSNNNLPNDTYNAISENNITCENLLLRLNKYIKYDKDKATLYHEDKVNRETKIVKANLNLSIDWNIIYKYYYMLNHIPGLAVSTEIIEPTWKFIVGLGHPSVYETSITLHHTHGFPIIPGQAIKGVVRNLVITNYYESDEDKAMKCPKFATIFGNEDRAGSVVFFDSYPISIPNIDFDIMNPHFNDYYSDNTNRKAPKDTIKPNPITFLNVAADNLGNNNPKTKFIIAVGVKEGAEIDLSEYPDINTLNELITKTLTLKGLGTKTSAGYGFFKISQLDTDFRRKYKSYKDQIDAILSPLKAEVDRIIENINIDQESALIFLQDENKADNNPEKELIESALVAFYSDKDIWDKKKLNGQVLDFVNQAYSFYLLTNNKYPEILDLAKAFASKKQKKKLKA